MQPALPASPHRRRLLVILLTLALLLGSVAAYNCYWDPYGKFHPKPAVSVFGPSTNYPLLTMFEVDRVPAAKVRAAEAILIGDSRTYQLTPGRTALVQGTPVLNLGVPGGSFEEALTLFSLEAPRLGAVRLLVVDVPMERFSEKWSPDRCRETWPVAESLLRYSLNWQTCQDSWMMARYLRTGVTTAHVYTGKKEEMPEVNRTLYNYWKVMFHAYDPERSQTRMKLLRKTLAPWQARGVKLVFWAPPLRPDLHGLLPEAGLEEAWQSLSAELRQMGPLVDWKDETGLPGVPFTFKDPVHVAEGAAELEWLLREKRD